MNPWDLLAQGAWKGTVILSAGFAGAIALRRASAAVRHWLWTAVFTALLVLPIATLTAPKWNLPVTGQSIVVVVRGAADHAPSAPAPTRPVNPLPWIYAIGVLAVAIRFAAGAIRTRHLLTPATPSARFGIPRRVPVVESATAPVPLVWGIFRPIIVLPAASRDWSPGRLRTVLLHELIHVQRRDLLAQVTAQIACCLYWFHPLAWIAAREQRKERERACDDAVLHRGIAAPEYAGHLVDLVRGLTVQAPAMAEASDFEGRVRALLDRGRNRAPLTRRVALTVAAVACALILPMASITSHAQVAQGALVGVVTDPAGIAVPDVAVTVKNLDGANEQVARTNAAGAYAFRTVPPGRYELQLQAPGFKRATSQAVITTGTQARVDARLALGEVTESVTVKGARPPAAARPVRNSTPRQGPFGKVMAARLVSQVRPVYPPELLQQHVTGIVRMSGIISKDGEMIDTKVLSKDVHPSLVQAALDAVRQWRWDPTLLNGQPVEVVTTMDISFELDQ